MDARDRATLDVIEIVPVIEEKLGDDIVGTGVYFLLQVLQLLHPVRGFGMPFREAGHTDAHFGEVGFDEPDQVDGVREILDCFGDGGYVGGLVAPKGKHVIDAVLPVEAEDAFDLVAFRSDAGQVRNDRQAGLLLDFRNQVVRALARRATCSIGYADIRGIEGKEVRDGFKEGLPVFLLFRGEKFQAENRFFSAFEYLFDKHPRKY